VTDPLSVTALCDLILAAHGRVDVLINASGVDVRKPFADHSLADLERSVDVNLLGAMLLTHTFLPAMRQRRKGTIVHVGGFGDGRLAFPYYTADVATRAGLFSFIEALNRELRLEGSPVKVAYFSPAPADTEAERPFHPIWKTMGLRIAPVEKVAAALLRAVGRGETVHIMGGWSTSLFAKLNAAWPRLADALLLNGYGRILQHHFAPAAADTAVETAAQKPHWLRTIALTLIVLSFVLYGALLALPFAPLTVAGKLALTPVLIGLGEATFWVGGLILGKEVLGRYKSRLRRFFTCK
jgi:short-subunit dehydrogenase